MPISTITSPWNLLIGPTACTTGEKGGRWERQVLRLRCPFTAMGELFYIFISLFLYSQAAIETP
jgi:hypothetical protein